MTQETKQPTPFSKLSDFEKQGERARKARLEGEKICCNTSVGCIIENESQEFLLIRRTKGELGFAGVAGHALDKLDNWEDSMVAELSEEVGIEDVKKEDLLEIKEAQNAYPNQCARKGGDKHAWKLYNLVVQGRPTKSTSDDGVKGFQWVKLDYIKQLVEKTKVWYEAGKPRDDEDHLEPVWVLHFGKAGLLDGVDISWLNDLEVIKVNFNA